MHHPNSFDTRGFVFGICCIAGVVALFSITRIALAQVSEHIASEPYQNLAAVETKLAALREKHITASVEVAPRFTTNNAPLPKVSAKAFLVGDVDSGVQYASKNETTPRPIASITKLLTALVAQETLSPKRMITLTRDDRVQTEGTPGSITRDETFSVDDLLDSLLMESNNSVAYALARTDGTSAFMQKMYEKSREAGMKATMLDDPSGISEKNAASAADIFALTRFVHGEAPELLDITRAKTNTITAKSGRTYSLANFNVFTSRPDFVGGKTGYTDAARETMTTVFEVPVGDETATISIVVLGSEDRKADVSKLLAWFTRNAEITQQ